MIDNISNLTIEVNFATDSYVFYLLQEHSIFTRNICDVFVGSAVFAVQHAYSKSLNII
ncbi:hypothetical protein [Pedobacter sp. JCM 36344]|uniref:hypothetical protein n=1 Tax=Pedobacter sp. JCM 36344 TaxID=3374280 RepID=UPI00397BD1AC